MKNEIDRFYLAIKEIAGITGLTAVSKLLGYSPQAMKNWSQRQIPAEALLVLYERLRVDPLWIRSGNGEMLPSSVPLTGAQKHWLSLMEGLIDDDIEEFAGLIEARRQKNLKISRQLSGKRIAAHVRTPSPNNPELLSNDIANKLRDMVADTGEQRQLVDQIIQTNDDELKRRTG